MPTRLRKADAALVKAGGRITWAVGTMWVAILFAAIAFISLPAAIQSGSALVIVAWVAQTFLQLVLLPVIMVGQNLMGAAAEKRAATQAAASDARSERTLEGVEKLLALQTAKIAVEHKKTRDHVTAALRENNN